VPTAIVGSQLNEAIYCAVAGAMGEALQTRIDDLFRIRSGRTPWDELKREPKRPRPREVASFLKHIEAMTVLADGLPPVPDMLSVPKRTQFVTEARALDVHEMRAMTVAYFISCRMTRHPPRRALPACAKHAVAPRGQAARGSKARVPVHAMDDQPPLRAASSSRSAASSNIPPNGSARIAASHCRRPAM
jgi:hypothetical protein